MKVETDEIILSYDDTECQAGIADDNSRGGADIKTFSTSKVGLDHSCVQGIGSSGSIDEVEGMHCCVEESIVMMSY